MRSNESLGDEDDDENGGKSKQNSVEEDKKCHKVTKAHKLPIQYLLMYLMNGCLTKRAR